MRFDFSLQVFQAVGLVGIHLDISFACFDPARRQSDSDISCRWFSHGSQADTMPRVMSTALSDSCADLHTRRITYWWRKNRICIPAVARDGKRTWTDLGISPLCYVSFFSFHGPIQSHNWFRLKLCVWIINARGAHCFLPGDNEYDTHEEGCA